MNKKNIALGVLIGLCTSVFCNAQNQGLLYGMTSVGGTGNGNIFAFDPVKDSVIANTLFAGANGDKPRSGFIQATNHFLYAMVYNTIGAPQGEMIRLNPYTNKDSVLFVFSGNNGGYPYGNLLQASDGLLYGMTSSGGTGNGVLFNYNINSGAQSVLLNFGTKGVQPKGSLIQTKNGLLYGMTYNSSFQGAFFSFDPTTNIDSVLFNFNGGNGAFPEGTPLLVNDSLLYGLTSKGGGMDSGVLFGYNINSGIQNVLINFRNTTGYYPLGSLMQASNGKLYGMTSMGGANNMGVIFCYNISTNNDSIVFNFSGINGSNPQGSLIQGNDGLLYGMTLSGGKYNNGVVFRFNILTDIEDTIESFNGANGSAPYGDLLEEMSATITQHNVICFGDSSGSAAVHVRGGHYPLTYTWSNGATTDSVSGLKAGNYTGLVKDKKGITYSFNFTITQPPLLKDSISMLTNVSCNGNNNGAITIDVKGGTKPYSYLWSPSLQTNNFINNLIAGTYTFAVTDSNHCITPDTIIITQPALLKDSVVSVVNVLCNGNSTGSATIRVKGGTKPYSYLWTAGAGTDSIAGNIKAGTYTCQVADFNNCITSINAIITSPSAIQTITSYTPTPCTKTTGSVSVSVSGGVFPYTYLWSPGDNTNALDTAQPSGLYTCTITDSNNCSVSPSVYLPNTGGPRDSIISSTNETCFGQCIGSATIRVVGGHLPYTFSWSPSGGTDTSAIGLCAGTYTFTTLDSIGCSGTAIVNVTEPPQLRDSITSFTNVSCFGRDNGRAVIGIKGGVAPYNYFWSSGAGVTDSAVDITIGTYSCSITDFNNCKAPAPSITITGPTLLIVDTMATATKCGTRNGSASVIASGGTPSYNYSWSAVISSNATVTNLAGGTYFCTVTDSLGCVNKVNVVVPDTGGPRDTVILSTAITCYGANTGSAIVNTLSGAAPFAYSWSPSGGTYGFALNLKAGTYVCTVTDSTGCIGKASVTFTQPPQLIGIINTIGVCSGASGGGSASINVNGGVSPYMYNWSNGSTYDTIANVGQGSYLCMVTDSNNCKIYPACSIVQAAKLADSIVSYPPSCIGCKDGWIQAYPYGGVPQGDSLYYLFVWNDATTASSIHNLDTGVYHVCITTNYCPNESICDSGTVVTGISAINDINNSVKIYPVPTNGLVNVELTEMGLTTVTISDEMGNTVLVRKVNSGNSADTIAINMSQFSDGIYIARIANEKGVAVKKIVLQK